MPLFLRQLLCITILALGACNRPALPMAVSTAPAPSIAPDPGPQQLLDCCRQCLQASERDPAGLDISQRGCTHYRGNWRGGTGVEANCTAVLKEPQWTVKRCRELVEKTQP